MKGGSRRKASIQCNTHCIFAVLNREQFKKFLASISDYANENTVDFLRQEPLFQAWSRGNLLKLLQSIQCKKVYKQSVILKENERNKYFYLIKNGEFELTKKIIKTK